MTAKRPVVIVNPRSGPARTERTLALLTQALFPRHSVEVLRTQRSGEAREFASSVSHACPMVMILGGDGTINEVVSGLMDGIGREHPLPPIGLLPTGTANCLAHELGVPANAHRAIQIIKEGNRRGLDLGVAHLRVPIPGQRRAASHDALKSASRYFLCMLGAGFDAEVTRAYHAVRGKRSYVHSYVVHVLSVLRALSLPRIRVDVDGRPAQRGAASVIVGNIKTYGVGMAVTPGAVPDDGRLDVCAFTARTRRDFARTILNVALSRHVGQRDVHGHVGRRISLSSEDLVPVQLDGDFAGYLPAEVMLKPRAVSVFVP